MFDLPGFVPYSEQITATDRIIKQTTKYQIYAGPTGSGKSYIGLSAHRQFNGKSWFLTPRVEIIAGMMDKIGIEFATDAELISKSLALQITTPIRFHNMLLKGDIGAMPERIILDECHHESAETYQRITEMLPEGCWFSGLTATPYRGTPKGTAAFLERWGKPEWTITYAEALKQKRISFPICDTWPLVDDDLVEIGSNGDFVISKITKATSDKMYDALKRAKDKGLFLPDGSPRRAMLITIPSAGVIPALKENAKLLGLKIACITDESSYTSRQIAFAGCVQRLFALAHINTVGEGVDLPIRIQLDLSPTLSPVMFAQRFGRITRPISHNEDAPEYYCTNRNLERHGYLFDGIMPASVIAKCQTEFQYASERIGYRAFGLTSLGKLHGFRMKLTNGLQVTCYSITQMIGHTKHEFFVIAHPVFVNPIYFEKKSDRVSVAEEKTQYNWGKWELLQSPPAEFTGFRSSPAKIITEPQKRQWEQWAERVGLDKTQNVTTRNIQTMFVLRDARSSLV